MHLLCQVGRVLIVGDVPSQRPYVHCYSYLLNAISTSIPFPPQPFNPFNVCSGGHSSYIAIQLAAFIPLLYMCICSTFAVFRCVVAASRSCCIGAVVPSCVRFLDRSAWQSAVLGPI